MKSKEVLNLIAMSKMYNQRPSNIASIEDEYTAYCLDEACALITNKINNGEEPMFTKRYTSFSDLYKNIGNK